MSASEKVGTKIWQEIAVMAATIVAALLVGAVFMLITGRHPLTAYAALARGAFGGWYNLGETLVYATPLICTGLAIALAYRCGLFNIGAEGQLIVAMLVTAWIGAWPVGGVFHILLAVAGGMLAGALWGFIPGVLKAKAGAHEVINSIMLNYLARFLTHYLVTKPLIAPPGTAPVTRPILASAVLPLFMPPSRANMGFFVALLACVAVYLFLWRTTWGYEVRAVGFNPEASRYGGVKTAKAIIMAMTLSGALAGLGGACVTLGVQHKFFDLFDFPGYGFDGIAVALIGRNHPFGVIFGALLFGSLYSGALQMQSVAGIPKEIIGIVQGTIILFVAVEWLFRSLILPRRRRAAQAKEVVKVGSGA